MQNIDLKLYVFFKRVLRTEFVLGLFCSTYVNTYMQILVSCNRVNTYIDAQKRYSW